MLAVKVPWNLKAVLSVHVLRLAVGLLLVRALYPLLFNVTPFVVELTDRVVVVALVWFTVHKYRSSFRELGLSLGNFSGNFAKGICVGFLLLGISVYSERLYTTVLFLTPNQHPLVAQVQNAATLRELAVPLFLAGLAAPVSEEVLYRLFTFLPLKERWGLWGGALASAAIFALMHFNAYWLAEIIVVGIGLALLYYWSGSLVSSIVAHSFINTAKVFMVFFGIPLV